MDLSSIDRICPQIILSTALFMLNIQMYSNKIFLIKNGIVYLNLFSGVAHAYLFSFFSIYTATITTPYS